MESVLKEIGSVLYDGIRPHIPGQGGEDCINFLSPRQLVGETLLATAIMVVAGSLSWRTFTMPRVFPKGDEPLVKRLLLTFLCVLFGIETGYKICHRSVLFLLNPCHVITMTQVLFCECTSPIYFPSIPSSSSHPLLMHVPLYSIWSRPNPCTWSPHAQHHMTAGGMCRLLCRLLFFSPL